MARPGGGGPGGGGEPGGGGLVRERTFTKEERKAANGSKEEPSPTGPGSGSLPGPGSGSGSLPGPGSGPANLNQARKARRQWKSQASFHQKETGDIMEEFFQREKGREEGGRAREEGKRAREEGGQYGSVVCALRARLAEQGDATAQMEVARCKDIYVPK